MLLVGGNANNGANAGFANSNTNNTPSNDNANIGSQLCFQKIDDHYSGRDLASWQKINYTEKVLVPQGKAPEYESECE